MRQVTASHYYWRWIVEAVRQAASFWSNLVALVVAKLILLYQVHYGVIQTNEFRSHELSIFWPYFCVLCAYLLYGVLRAPLELDRDRAQRIEELEKHFLHEFRGEITQLNVLKQFGIAAATSPSSMNISAVIQVRYLGNEINMSIHAIQFWLIGSEIGSTVISRPWEVKGRFIPPVRLEATFTPVPPAQVERAKAPGSQWKFTFKDHLDTEYESEIFTM